MADGMLYDTATTEDIHAAAVTAEIAWLGAVVEARLRYFLGGTRGHFSRPKAPDHPSDSRLGALVGHNDMTDEARLILALAIAPQVNSEVLDPFFVQNSAIGRRFSQFGGGQNSTGGFIPTIETALFLLAGSDGPARIAAMRFFDPDHPLRKAIGLTLANAESGAAGAELRLPVSRLVALCRGAAPAPDYSPDFPAKRLSASLEWSDLILAPETGHEVQNILSWLENRRRILDDWGFRRHFGEGFKVLFHGPPGTGKTLTATLLGKRAGLDVYRIDLSMVVSKYIGETEKNLARVFDMAEEQDWILFFDEADALFGARTSTSSSNDRYANQEVSYLLQRVEDCQSLVVLATNLRSNIDEAFTRRFQLSVGFARPTAEARVKLWAGVLRDAPLAEDVDYVELAGRYALSGAAIANIARHASILALRRGSDAISTRDLRQSIANEMRKEGRTL